MKMDERTLKILSTGLTVIGAGLAIVSSIVDDKKMGVDLDNRIEKIIESKNLISMNKES